MNLDKKNRDLLIAGTLVAVFLLTFSKNVLFRSGPRPPASSQAAASRLPADLSFLASAQRNEDVLRRQREVSKGDWGRDPFDLAATASEASLAGLKLIGVVWDQAAPVAMINGEVLHIGEKIAGYRVVEIRPSSVLLWAEAGVFHELQLFEKEKGASQA